MSAVMERMSTYTVNRSSNKLRNPADMRLFDIISNPETEQESWDYWGGFTSWDDFTQDVYRLDKPSAWKLHL